MINFQKTESVTNANNETVKVLCINKEKFEKNPISSYLKSGRFSTQHTHCLIDGLDIIAHDTPDIVIAETPNEKESLHNFLTNTSNRYDDLPIIVISEQDEIDQPEEKSQAGAWAFIKKDEIDRGKVDDAIDKALLKRENKRYEKIIHHNHGYLAELEEHKEELKHMIDKQDIELSKAKEMLQRMQKMESLAFLAVGLSHDLQNMNSVMLSAISSLEHSASKNEAILPGNTKTYLNLIKQANKSSSKIVRKLEDLFEEKQNMFFDFDLVAQIDHTLDICRHTLPSTITILGCSERTAAYFHGDQVSIDQALLNLCINASHAMTIMRTNPMEGGNLTITLSSCEKEAEHNDGSISRSNYWKISLSDTGIGMSEETIKKIFEPMFTTKRKGVGTGLGMVMIKHIVDMHDGTIEVESELGKGTTFHLFLPKSQNQQPSLFKTNI